MSDTPRTDAEYRLNGVREDGREYVNVEFARDLERECSRLDEGLNRACDRITDLERTGSGDERVDDMRHALELDRQEHLSRGPTMKFASHCPDGQKCGATTTGCMEGECQRDPLANHSPSATAST